MFSFIRATTLSFTLRRLFCSKSGEPAIVLHAPASTVAVPLWSKLMLAQQFAINRLLRSKRILVGRDRKENVAFDNEETPMQTLLCGCDCRYLVKLRRVTKWPRFFLKKLMMAHYDDFNRINSSTTLHWIAAVVAYVFRNVINGRDFFYRSFFRANCVIFFVKRQKAEEDPDFHFILLRFYY
ncbi:hypothetical protein AVEN_173847-1 [Araneus ventricosus]|uniref:Uncharacterized protein n=1 Tax=Araneus ventricosus TaxID=182803 RepID=A0A4Y2QAI6_ARAVE|nr:hypothetical protein AVEN_173847-1 [Araneus ventricosus]